MLKAFGGEIFGKALRMGMSMRPYATKLIFDEQCKAAQIARAYKAAQPGTFMLHKEIADRLVDRLDDLSNKEFSRVLLHGAHGHLLEPFLEGIPIQQLDRVDTMALKPLASNTFDVVLSHMALHYVNDLEEMLTEVKRTLRPDGVFIASLLGGTTLHELRVSLQLAEQERQGGLGLHIAPTADGRDLSRLLQQCGFAITTVDMDDIVINYPSCLHLMQDLQSMGENNCLYKRPLMIQRDTLLASSAIYEQLYGASFPATFQVFYLIGWKPSDTQPRPLDRGSAQHSLKHALS